MNAIEMLNKDENKVKHPGWAVRFSNARWLVYGHGYHTSENPFYAKIANSKEGAESYLKEAREDRDIPLDWEGEAVAAWEPVVAKMQHQIDELEAASKLSPDDILEMFLSLEGVLGILKKGQ